MNEPRKPSAISRLLAILGEPQHPYRLRIPCRTGRDFFASYFNRFWNTAATQVARSSGRKRPIDMTRIARLHDSATRQDRT
jgi:hypothetical protein